MVNASSLPVTLSYYSSGLLRNMQSSGDLGGKIRLWDGNSVLLLQDGALSTTYWWFELVQGIVVAEKFMDGERQDYLVDFLGSITGSSVPDGSGSSYSSETYRVLGVQEPWVHLQIVKSMDDLFLRTRHIRGVRWRSAHEERAAQINP